MLDLSYRNGRTDFLNLTQKPLNIYRLTAQSEWVDKLCVAGRNCHDYGQNGFQQKIFSQPLGFLLSYNNFLNISDSIVVTFVYTSFFHLGAFRD